MRGHGQLRVGLTLRDLSKTSCWIGSGTHPTTDRIISGIKNESRFEVWLYFRHFCGRIQVSQPETGIGVNIGLQAR